MGKIDYTINLVYTYITPFGRIDNGYQTDVLKKIYKESLKVKDNNLYTSEFREYCSYLSNNNKYKINYVNKYDIWKTPQSDKFLNLYIFENIKEKKFRIGEELIDNLEGPDNYYFIILDKNNEITETFISEITEFKLKYKINRNRFFYFSKEKQIKDVGCIKDISSFNFIEDNFMKQLITKIENQQKIKFL